MALVAKVRTRSGLRFTSPTDSLSIDVEAYGTVGDAVSRVGFVIYPSTGPTAGEETWERELRFPNYSSGSPLPGAGASMAPLWCHGMTIDADAWPAGWIQVVPYVVSTGAAPRLNLDPIWVLNDSDGADRRGSTKTIYLNSATGDDLNLGTSPGLPVKTLARAILAARFAPGGEPSNPVSMNAGGARIVAEGTFVGANNINYPSQRGSWHTGNEWLTIEAGPAGATYVAASQTMSTQPTDYIYADGVTAQSTRAALRFVGWEFRGTLQIEPSANCTPVFWGDNLTVHNYHWSAATRWSVRFRETPSDPVSFTGAGGKKYLSCSTFEGVLNGPSNYDDVHDVLITDWVGIAFQTSGWSNSPSAVNCLVEHQRYTSSEVDGFVDIQSNGNLSISVPSNGVVRITATATVFQEGFPGLGVDVGAQLETLEGSSIWQLRVTGATSPAFNGYFDIVATGTDYVEVSNPAVTVATPGEVLPTDGRIRTWGTNVPSFGQPLENRSWNEIVHPDIFWVASISNTIFSNIACRDIQAAQSIFTSFSTVTNVVFFNVSDGGNGIAANFQGTHNNVVLAHCTFSGPCDFPGTSTSMLIVNNVWRSSGNLPAHGADGNVVDTNHTFSSALSWGSRWNC